MARKYLDNTKLEFTEVDMYRFALDYMEMFQFDIMIDAKINKRKAKAFLEKRIKKIKIERDSIQKNNQKANE